MHEVAERPLGVRLRGSRRWPCFGCGLPGNLGLRCTGLPGPTPETDKARTERPA
jgi:hypothetical protein